MTKTLNTQINVGEIWYSSGGYDQTNVDFYRVLRTTRTMVILERIGKEVIEDGFMAGKAYPDETAATGKEDLRRKVQWDNGEPMIVVQNYSMGACAYPWDGKPKYCSWYA